MKLIGKKYDTPNMGGYLKAPKLIVLHYTASPDLDSAVKWMCQKRSAASAHYVVGRDGAIVDLVPENRVAWTNGRSTWKGLSGLNNHAISIEIVNLGFLQQDRDGKFRATGSQVEVPEKDVFETGAVSKYGVPYWQRYTSEQYAALRELIASIQIRNPTITEIVGHEHVSPGRKFDPGPALDWTKLGLTAPSV